MATIKAFVRTTTKNKERVHIRFRLSDGTKIQLFHKSEITIPPHVWDARRQEIKSNVLFDFNKRRTINAAVMERKELILELYANSVIKTSAELDNAVRNTINPPIIEATNFFDIFDLYLSNRTTISDARKARFKVLQRAMKRFEEHSRISITFDSLTAESLTNFERFLCNEPGRPRSMTTISCLMKALRAFIRWAVDREHTSTYAFSKYTMPTELYGTPYYLTIEERNRLYNADLSNMPQLAIQRDIFVFHCFVGCRVGDLLKMTRSNLVNGAIEYIPRKTKEGRPVTVRVPLNTSAFSIVERYRNIERDELLPFISSQKYNDAIKRIFTIAGLTRNVVILDPLTRQQIIRPLNEIASSHLARRTFIGNLYKQVKDPNLIGALSGHVEGSKAFARYRTIDDDIKKELVQLLE